MFDVVLTRFALRNPIVVTLLYVSIALFGLLACTRMGRNVLPPVSFPAVTISAPYPGAAPREIERLVIEPIEDQIAALSGVDRLIASAQDGNATMTVRFRFGSNTEADRANVQQAVDAARTNLPQDLVPPVVMSADPSQAPVLLEAVTSAVLSMQELSDAVDTRIAPALRATPNVSRVVASGGTVGQMTVFPDAAALNAIGGTPLDVLRAVSSAGDVFPGGRLRGPADAAIGIRASAESAEALTRLPVSIPGARAISVGDVARAVANNADDTVITRVDRQRGILLYVSRAQDRDSTSAIASAGATFARLAKDLPLVRFERLTSDQPSTSAEIDGVVQSLGEGIALTVLVMLFFLHAWRSAAISAVAIPASLLAAFSAMWLAGFTINVLSLMALSLTIGILVDDSIVILEAISRFASSDRSGDEAALAGRRELGGAAIAITLVDVAVFLPLAFMPGIVGEFMREFGAVIVFATAFSLLVSLTLTPLLASRWALRPRENQSRALPWMLTLPVAQRNIARARSIQRSARAAEVWILQAYATRWLPAAWQRRRSVLVCSLVSCGASLVLMLSGAISSEFSPATNRGQATVNLTFPAGTPLAATDARAMRIAGRLLDDDRVAHAVTTAGRAFNGSSDVFAGNVAQIDAVLADPAGPADPYVDEIKALQALAPDATFSGSGKGMGGVPQIVYKVAGASDAVDAAAARIAQALTENGNATDVRLSDAGRGPRIDVTIDPSRAALLGVSSDDAAQTARIATGGTIAAKVRTSGGMQNVIVRFDAAERGDLDAILRTTVRSNADQLVPLGDVASATTSSEPAIIERENGERVVSVTANAAGSAPIGSISGPLAARLRDPNFLPAGARVVAGGDIEQFLETVADIGTTLAGSVAIVYVILAVLYRSYSLPLIIMLTVPLASVGAFGALFATAQPLNLYSMLGIVMLVGIVAKNGILLVEFAERRFRDGAAPLDAMFDAARVRFRPILMTTLAMIAGMLPLALGRTIGAEYRQALGIVVIGGLSSSLMLTLFVVPIVYVWHRSRAVRRLEPRTLHPGPTDRPAGYVTAGTAP